jgi:hypothetical protein
MISLGILLAGINTKFLQDERCSTAGLLTVLVTAYFLIARFESNIAVEFSELIRVILILYLLDVVFGASKWKQPISEGGVTTQQEPQPLHKNLIR